MFSGANIKTTLPYMQLIRKLFTGLRILSATVTVVLRCCYYQQRDECCGVVDLVGNSRLTVKPRNTVALSGDRVTIHCSSDSGGKRIQWIFGTHNPKCRSRGDMCNMVIDRVQPRHAGGYDCHDGRGKAAQASLIVIGNVSQAQGLCVERLYCFLRYNHI